MFIIYNHDSNNFKDSTLDLIFFCISVDGTWKHSKSILKMADLIINLPYWHIMQYVFINYIYG